MKLLRAAACCLFAGAPLWSQSLPADELRVRIREYSPPLQPKIRVGTDLVLLRVVVRDKSGKVVSGLQQGDFEVRDRGRLYTMSLFSEEVAGAPPKTAPAVQRANATTPIPAGPEPRYVAIFMDDANLPLSDLVPARDAAVSFVKNNLKPGDQVGLFTSSLQQIQDFTEDTSKILAQLAEVRSQHRRADDGPGACPWIGVQQAYQIVQQRDIEALNLAIEQALNCPAFYVIDPQKQVRNAEIMVTVTRQADVVFAMAEQYSHRTMGAISRTVDYLGRMPGKRVMLLASSGFWTRSLKREQDRIVERAIRREITINSLDAKGLASRGVDYSQGAAPVLMSQPHLQYAADRYMRDQMESYNDPLSMLASGTGGQFFHNNNNLTEGLASLAEPPQVSYLMAFEPENLLADGSFHRLTVKMAKPNTSFSISTRPGYYAPTKQEQENRAQEDPFDDVVRSQTAFEEIPVQVTTQMGQSPLGEPTLHITVRVDVKKLPFQKRDDRHRQRLRYATAVFARDGTFLAGSQAQFELSLKDETLARLSAEGLEQKWTIDIPPGSFYVRQVVQEALEGGIAASTHQLEIKRQTASAQPRPER